MKKITSVLASLLLVLPLVGVAALSSTAGQAPEQEQSSDTYRCCWVFYNGMWYCMPC